MGSKRPDIVLTNDDGIDAPGLEAVYDRLTEIGDVTVVAPSTDNSGIGRVLSMGRSTPIALGDDTERIELEAPEYSWEVPFRPHELGYEVVGTPADCVVAAVSALEVEPDVIVSGCNPGPNVGLSVLERSGTVSAAVEAAHLGVPGIAVSSTATGAEGTGFAVESDFVGQLVRFSLGSDLFGTVDYLNALVPPSVPERVAVTEPSATHNVSAAFEESEGRFVFTHTAFEELRNGREGSDEAGTDRRAIGRDEASVSPLTLREGPVESDLLQAFAEQYRPRVEPSSE